MKKFSLTVKYRNPDLELEEEMRVDGCDSMEEGIQIIEEQLKARRASFKKCWACGIMRVFSDRHSDECPGNQPS